MKKCITFILLLAFVGCGSDKTSTTTETSSTTTGNSASASSTSSTSGGPTDSVDPVAVTPSPDPTPTLYPDVAPTPTTPDYGSAISDCGKIYRKLNDTDVTYESSGGDLYKVNSISYEAEILIQTTVYPNDSFSLCIEGFTQTVGSEDILNLNLFHSKVAVANISRAYEGDYPHEICGQFKLRTSFGNGTYYEMQSAANISYELEGIDSIDLGTFTSDKTVNACVYSHDPHWQDYDVTHRPFFRADALDLGVYNQ